LLAGIFISIEAMIISMIFLSVVALFLNSIWTKILIKYSIIEQLLDVAPSFLLALIIGFALFLLKYVPIDNDIIILSFQIISALILIFGISEITKPSPYCEIKRILKEGIFNVQAA